tara:strand:+ start:177 stop:659 length:483 start_codon:yes stop_codon:yes gene_type:complete
MNKNNATLLIQRYYRGYKTRKTLSNIFKKLPNEIQKYILDKYIRKNYYINNFNKQLKLVVSNRVFINTNDFLIALTRSPETFLDFWASNEDKLYYTCYLCEKYNNMIDEYIISVLRRIFKKFNIILMQKYYFNHEISFKYKEKLRNIYFKCASVLTRDIT